MSSCMDFTKPGGCYLYVIINVIMDIVGRSSYSYLSAVICFSLIKLGNERFEAV